MQMSTRRPVADFALFFLSLSLPVGCDLVEWLAEPPPYFFFSTVCVIFPLQHGKVTTGAWLVAAPGGMYRPILQQQDPMDSPVCEPPYVLWHKFSEPRQILASPTCTEVAAYAYYQQSPSRLWVFPCGRALGESPGGGGIALLSLSRYLGMNQAVDASTHSNQVLLSATIDHSLGVHLGYAISYVQVV